MVGPWSDFVPNSLNTVTKNTGTRKMAKGVPSTMPQSTPLPISRWLAALAPDVRAAAAAIAAEAESWQFPTAHPPEPS